MANEITDSQWAPVEREVAPDTWEGVFPGPYSAVSSEPTVCSIGIGTAGVIAAVGQAEGSFTITVTRASDGATASLDGTVTTNGGGGGLPPFNVRLGTAQPKG